LDALKRPPIRPYAAYSAHDPEPIFSISPSANIGFQKDVYAEKHRRRGAAAHHFPYRAAHPQRGTLRAFYAEVFGLALLNRREGDENFYLSDGRVTLAVLQWKLSDYYGRIRRAPGSIMWALPWRM